MKLENIREKNTLKKEIEFLKYEIMVFVIAAIFLTVVFTVFIYNYYAENYEKPMIVYYNGGSAHLDHCVIQNPVGMIYNVKCRTFLKSEKAIM